MLPERVGAFSALKLRDFRLIWFSSFFFSAGMWIQMTTLGWLVYDLTGSSSLLGAMNGMRAIPTLLLAPLAGVAVDRMDRRKVMLATQISTLLLTLSIAILITLDRIEIWHLFAYTLLAGMAQVFNMPAQQTVVFDLVPRRLVPNSVALMTASFNSTRVIGPSLAGFLIAVLGPEGNFFIQSAAYVGVVACVLMIRFPPRSEAASRRQSPLKNLSEGIQYVAKTPLPRTLLLFGIVAPILLIPSFMALMPVFVKDVYHAGPAMLGYLLSSMGVGGLLGALTTASLGSYEHRGKVLLAALGAMALSIFVFSFMRNAYAAFPFLIIAGFTEMLFMGTNQAAIQLSVPDNMRGRVTSLFMINMGLMPLGSLVVGIIADWTGAPVVVAATSALAFLVVVFVAVFVPRVRNLRYSQMVAAVDSSHGRGAPPAPQPGTRA
jgi:MFS family permease